jgi:hypothetical protein
MMKMMKPRRFKFALLLLASCVAVAAIAGPAKDFEKKIEQEYPITADGNLEIRSKYGNVDVETWSELKVKIVVTITVDARNQEKADEVLDRININFSNTASLVRASTEINTAKSWSRWFGSNGDKFEISYHVLIPETINVDLENKYGAIYLASISGAADISLKYGKLRVDGVGGDLKLYMGYSKGSVTSAGDLDLVLSYSNLTCGDLGDISVTSKYSKFEAGSVGTIHSTSSYDGYDIKKATSVSNVGKYDDMSFGEADEISMTTKYSQLDVRKLNEKADLHFRYGGITLDGIGAGFSRIEIQSEYTGVALTIDPDAKFSLDASSKYCGIKYSNLEVYYDVQSNNESRVKGYRGSKEGGGEIFATLKYGSFKIY